MTREDVASALYVAGAATLEYVTGCIVLWAVFWFVWLKPIFE